MKIRSNIFTSDCGTSSQEIKPKEKSPKQKLGQLVNSQRWNEYMTPVYNKSPAVQI